MGNCVSVTPCGKVHSKNNVPEMARELNENRDPSFKSNNIEKQAFDYNEEDHEQGIKIKVVIYKEWGEVSPLLFALSFCNIKFKTKMIPRNDTFGLWKKYGTLPVIRRKDKNYMSDTVFNKTHLLI